MRTVLHATDRDEVRSLRRSIDQKFGSDASTLFMEVCGNVKDHVTGGEAILEMDEKGFLVEASSSFEGSSSKEEGTGGYGLQMITVLGGLIQGCQVRWMV